MALSETAELIVQLKLQDQLTSGISKVKSDLNSAADQIKARYATLGSEIQKGIGVGLGIGIAQVTAQAIGEVKNFVESSVNAARDEELSIARLTASLKANVTAWDGNIEAVEKHILVNTQAAFSDDELRQSLGSLVAATHDTTKAFEDQQTAIDLARFSGKSLEEATQAIIAVEAGRFRGLAQLGISIKGVTTSEEALAKIRETVAGQSAAFLETDAGKAAALNVSIQELSESFGKTLTPALTTATVALTNFFNVLNGSTVAGFQQKATDNIKQAADFVTHATQVELDNAIKGVKAVLAESLANPLGDPGVQQNARTVIALLEGAKAGYEDAAGGAGDYSNAQDKANQSTKQATVSLGDLSSVMGQLDLGGLASDLQNTGTALDQVDINARAAAAGLDIGHDATIGFSAAARDLAKALNDIPRNIDINFQFGLSGAVNKGLPPGSADTNRGSTFLPGGDQSALDAANAASATQAQLDAARATAAKVARDKATADAKSAADKARAEAKQAADELAAAYREKVSNAFDKAKRASDSLFDALHDRHLKAIHDAEELAQKKHDAALDEIADQLSVAKAQNAVAVNRAQRAQDAQTQAQQLRDLHEAADDAFTALQKTPNDVGAQRALRNAREALVNFSAQQNISALQAVQAAKDKAAEDAAQKARDQADAQLEAAKLKAAADTAFANKADAKKKADFDLALDALKKKDIADPAKFLVDVKALQAKFGIFSDDRGFQHIGDVVAGALKNVVIPTPHITLNTSPSFILKLGPTELKGIAAAVASTANPSQAGSARTGQSTPRP